MMNPRIPNFRRISLSLLFPVAAAVFTLTPGCSTSPQPMHSGEGVPASEGTVKATEGANGNTNLTVRVKHLATPSKVSPGATVYVVWIKPVNGVRQSVGQLAVNDNLEGTLETVTAHRAFALTVTPEPNAQVSAPSNAPVFSSDVEISD